jgi:protein-S-isoprenylcysteine O-methyltransferase
MIRPCLWIAGALGMIFVDVWGGRRIKRSLGTPAAVASDDVLIIASLFALSWPVAAGLVVATPLPFARATLAVGSVVCCAGLILRALAMATLAGSYTLTPVAIPSGVVMNSGPYRIVRHPGYAGLLLQFGGLAVVVGQALGLVGMVWLVVCVAIRIRVEESVLIEAHTRDYEQYRTETRWKLVPGLF